MLTQASDGLSILRAFLRTRGRWIQASAVKLAKLYRFCP
jgi:hypothetical protein